MKVRVDRTFPSEYEIELVQELSPSGDNVVYIPGRQAGGGRDGLLIRITSHHRSWTAMIAFGRQSDFSAVLTSPSPERFVVVSEGSGYLIDAEQATYEHFSVAPIRDATPITQFGLLVFATHTNLIALGEDGIRWHSERLASDELSIDSITDSMLLCSGDDAPSGQRTYRKVDAATGSIIA